MKKRFILISIGILLPLNIKANSVSINCKEKELTKGNTTTCTLYGNTSESVGGASLNLQSTGGITISNVSTPSWQGGYEDGLIIVYTDNDKKGNFTIATFTATLNSEGTIKASGATFSINDKDVQVSGNSLALKEKIVETKQETKQETNNTNNSSNNTNTNTPKTNNTNTENTQPKEEKKSNDASLKELSISNGNIEFNPNTTSYTVEVSNDVEKVSINAVANDSNANIKIPSDLSLKDGDNKFVIEVTAQDGTKTEYKINVKRLDKILSNDSSLKTLSITGHDIDFDTEKYIYDIGEIKTSSLKVDAITNDSNATVKIHGNESIGKDDCIVIEVKAEDGTKTEYIIYVSNITKQKTPSASLILIPWILLFISFGFNGYFIYKNNKKDESNK